MMRVGRRRGLLAIKVPTNRLLPMKQRSPLNEPDRVSNSLHNMMSGLLLKLWDRGLLAIKVPTQSILSKSPPQLKVDVHNWPMDSNSFGSVSNNRNDQLLKIYPQEIARTPDPSPQQIESDGWVLATLLPTPSDTSIPAESFQSNKASDLR